MNTIIRFNRSNLFVFSIIFLLLSINFMPPLSGSTLNLGNLKERNTSFSMKQKENVDILTNDNETTYYAVIAAASQYNDSKKNIPKRPFPPTSDFKLKALYSTLLTYPNWKEENIILLINEDATKENIVRALENMSQRVTDRDVFLFQWCGHGSSVLDDDGDETDGYDEIICPYDLDKNKSVYLTDDMLNSNFSKIKAKGQIIIIESCLSGGLAGGGNDIDQENRVVILSTLPNSLGRGSYLFGFPLITGASIALHQQFNFSAKDHNNDGFLSIEETFQTSKFITLGTNALYWVTYWIYMLIDTKDVVFSLKQITVAFLFLESLSILLTGHFVLNIPHIIDNYPGELHLVQCV